MDENPYQSPETEPEKEPPPSWLVRLNWFGEDNRYNFPLFFLLAAIGLAIFEIAKRILDLFKF